MKRLFDIIASLTGMILLFPFFIVISIWIVIDDGAPVFFKQTRVGKDEVPFQLFKFRSMYKDAESRGQLTVGNTDPRVTKSGQFIRKFKLDELAQLINVLRGEMSIVGPRPEVPKYVVFYTKEQKEVLRVRPGLTDTSSLHFIDEDAILGNAKNPEEAYINDILPQKLALQLAYVRSRSFFGDIALIFKTIGKILGV
ncbi:MAG: sugar transferase [Flavobacteriales bacterium]|nr:sugar transferase [Flavobacteriales bacterium]